MIVGSYDALRLLFTDDHNASSANPFVDSSVMSGFGVKQPLFGAKSRLVEGPLSARSGHSQTKEKPAQGPKFITYSNVVIRVTLSARSPSIIGMPFTSETPLTC